MRKFTWVKLCVGLACAFFVLVSLVPCAVYAQEKIVAVINNDVITRKDLDDFLNFMRIQMAREYSKDEIEKKIRAMKPDLLNKLIEDILVLQEAKKENIKIDESRVKAKIYEIRRRFPSDVEFQQDLLKEGLTQADVEKKIREQLYMYYIIQGKIRSKIVVRPEEVTQYYNNNLQEFSTPEKHQFETFTLASKDVARSFALDLKTGQSVEDLATRYPFTLNAIEASPKELKKEIDDVVFKLNIADVSEPISVNDKFVIFKLDGVTASQQQLLPEAQEKIHALLFDQKLQEELSKWIDELKAKSYIKVLQS